MPDRLRRLVDLLPVVLAASLLVVLGQVWSARLAYPYDLEWMEGGMLAHAWRLARGMPLYVEPGPDFVPFVYPPGFASLVALVGVDYEVGRTIALLGAFSAAGAIGWGVSRHTGCRLSGVLAAVVFLGAYPASGAFYDMVRPDGLYTGLLGWAVVVGLERRRGADVAAGLLLAAAFVVKHNAAAFGVPIALGIFARDGWRATVRFGLASAVPALAFTVFMQIVSEGRFLVYLLEVPRSHPNIWGRVMPGLPRELGTALPIASSFPALWLVVQLRRLAPDLHPAVAGGVPTVAGVAFAWAGVSLWDFGPDVLPFGAAFAFWGIGAAASALALALFGGGPRWLSERRAPFSWRWVYGLGVLGVGVVVAALMRAHNGGYLNVYMHLHWLIAFSFGIALAQARTRAGLRWAPVAAAGLASLQLAWQLGTLDRAALTPTEQDEATGDLFVRAIEAYDGPVLSPFAAWLPAQAGKAPSLHLIALWDLNYEGGPYHAHVEVVRAAIRDHHWAAAIDGTRPFGYGLLENYEAAKTIPVEGQVFQPRTGWVVRPARVLEPRKARSEAQAEAPWL